MKKSYDIQLIKLDCIKEWDEFISRGIGGTVFHESWFLQIQSVNFILCAFQNKKLLCGLPIFGGKEDRVSIQSTISVPYCGPVFSDEIGSDRKGVLIKRKILELMIITLKKHFTYVSFACNKDITDMTPFIKEGFLPEVRYTYHYHFPSRTNINDLSKGRKLDLKKANLAGIKTIIDDDLSYCDITKLIKRDRNDAVFMKTKELFSTAIQQKKGKYLVALTKENTVAGGLFLCWDNRCSYTIYSYYEEKHRKEGIPTKLYIDAIEYTDKVLNLPSIDLEGSVLEGIEKFYQSLDGKQTLYFKLHWSEQTTGINWTDIYNYD
ncbi:hypothetical protein [Paenibacillus faecalis]|uniref:hypothetical protein n=1 Tax=Paenibacillus faecalis TaxID=2079532 RepID=UPI000D0F5797|nr:hypothetical protein [Paenibacillus faecalis]